METLPARLCKGKVWNGSFHQDHVSAPTIGSFLGMFGLSIADTVIWVSSKIQLCMSQLAMAPRVWKWPALGYKRVFNPRVKHIVSPWSLTFWDHSSRGTYRADITLVPLMIGQNGVFHHLRNLLRPCHATESSSRARAKNITEMMEAFILTCPRKPWSYTISQSAPLTRNIKWLQ